VSAGNPDPSGEFDEDARVGAETGPRTSSLDAAPPRSSASAAASQATAPPLLGTPRALGRHEGRVGSRDTSSSAISPRMTAIFGGLFGLATVASVFALLIQVFPVKNQRPQLASAVAPSASAEEPNSTEAERPKRNVLKRVRQELPQPWRVEDLKATHQVVKGDMLRRSLSGALDEEHVPKDQVYRILKAFDGVFKFDHPKKKDRFVVALERGSKKVIGFEYIVGPTEIYQAKSTDAGLLEAKRLDMQVKDEEFSSAFYVGKNFTKSYELVGLEPGLTKVLNEAFNGQTSTEAFQEGGIVKAILVERTSFGRFVGYDRVKALEYRPPDPSKPALRAYWFEGDGVKTYVDDKGRHPSNAGWRSPVPGAPVTSNFNPKRLHPVLHTVMPHNGTDFGAPSGTPVYASFRGKITWIGPQGPSGNLVLIEHPNGVQTGYAHLSRFADGIKIGDPIGTRQLVGYVGSTGRSTGPHLHFSAKRDGKFFDALELKLDSLQPMPSSERDAFAEQKARYDAALEAIAMPEPPEPDAPPSEESHAGGSGSGGSGAGNAGKAPEAEGADGAKGEGPSKSDEASDANASAGTKAKPDGAKPEKGDGPGLLGEDLSGEIE